MADEVAYPYPDPDPDQELSEATAGDTEAGTSGAEDGTVGTPAAPTDRPIRAERSALVVGLIAVVLLAGLVGWLGFRAHQAHNAEAKRNQFVQAARQAAVNLTTYDYQHIDADVQRILGSATGSFHDSFAHRAQSFRDIAGQVHSKSVGTVSEAGLESQTGDEGRVLVAVSVMASDLVGGAVPRPQALRMRITVKKMGDMAKASDVAFVS